MTMDPMIARYLEWAEQAGLAVNTRRFRRLVLGWLAAFLPVPLIEASPEQVTAWRKTLSHLCNQTIANYVSAIRQFYWWASEVEGLRPDNPAARVPAPRCGRRLPRPIGTGDLMRAISLAPRPIRLWLMLAAFCGLRTQEIALLRRECILDQAAVPGLLVSAEMTKGDNEHVIPLPLWLLTEIIACVPARGWAFGRLDGQPGPNSPHRVSARGNRFLRECGIGATMHQLRHWFGTETYAISGDLLAIAEMMGHRQLQSTRGYAKVSAIRMVEIVNALPVPPQQAAA
jgi:integrase